MSQHEVERTGPTRADEADVVAARRWARTLRRIDHVEFIDGGAHALIHGVAHRLPMTRRIPVPAARGLVALGCPATERRIG